jgi:hypothetical protein
MFSDPLLQRALEAARGPLAQYLGADLLGSDVVPLEGTGAHFELRGADSSWTGQVVLLSDDNATDRGSLRAAALRINVPKGGEHVILVVGGRTPGGQDSPRFGMTPLVIGDHFGVHVTPVVAAADPQKPRSCPYHPGKFMGQCDHCPV